MKNTLKVIGALVVFILGIIIIDALFVKETDEKVKSTSVDFTLSFSIDNVVGEYEIVEFSEEEKKNISNLLGQLNYDRVNVDLAFLGDYKIVFNDKELVFDENDDPYGQIVVDGQTYTINIKQLKETILNYVEKKELIRVYLYEKQDISKLDFKRIELEDEDRLVLKESFKNIRPLEEYEITNLAIIGKYYLIIDNERVYFDNLNGYAMYNDEMIKLDIETINVLKKYIVTFSNEECCSCCPDLKPGEYCIDACCSCN